MHAWDGLGRRDLHAGGWGQAHAHLPDQTQAASYAAYKGIPPPLPHRQDARQTA